MQERATGIELRVGDKSLTNDTIEKIKRGEKVPKRIQTIEEVFDSSRVTAEVLKNRQY